MKITKKLSKSEVKRLITMCDNEIKEWKEFKKEVINKLKQ
jgi:hypothetical protein